MAERVAEQIKSNEKCGRCGGTGVIETWKCSGEHGISTSCQEFGCFVETQTCPTCKGKRYVD